MGNKSWSLNRTIYIYNSFSVGAILRLLHFTRIFKAMTCTWRRNVERRREPSAKPLLGKLINGGTKPRFAEGKWLMGEGFTSNQQYWGYCHWPLTLGILIGICYSITVYYIWVCPKLGDGAPKIAFWIGHMMRTTWVLRFPAFSDTQTKDGKHNLACRSDM